MPPPFRRLLLVLNGAEPGSPSAVVPGHDDLEWRFVHGVQPGHPCDWAGCVRRVYDRIGKGMVPVAADSFGNLFVAEPAPPHRVWFWDHEEDDLDQYPSDETPEVGNLRPIAPSLEDFLAGLR